MGRFVNERIDNWGKYCFVKVNAVEVFRSELKRISCKGLKPSILLSSVTDPYQPQEHKYHLTRGILEALAEEPYTGQVSILTKSPMVLRDIDLLKKLPNTEIGMTVTTTDDKISRFLEVRALLVSSRLKTLANLNKNRIRTYAFVGPLLPHFRYDPTALDSLFANLVATGVEEVFVEHINLSRYITARLWKQLKHEPVAVQEIYKTAQTKQHREELDTMVRELIKEHHLKLRLGKVLRHAGNYT